MEGLRRQARFCPLFGQSAATKRLGFLASLKAGRLSSFCIYVVDFATECSSGFVRPKCAASATSDRATLAFGRLVPRCPSNPIWNGLSQTAGTAKNLLAQRLELAVPLSHGGGGSARRGTRGGAARPPAASRAGRGRACVPAALSRQAARRL